MKPGSTAVRTVLAISFAFVSLHGCIVSAADSTGTPQLQPFTASYAVRYKGLNAGTTTLRLERDGDGLYLYETSAKARGIFRIVFSDEITQTSRFVIRDGHVVPLHYRADDGSDDTERDISLDFDWKARRATGVAEDEKVDIEVPSGAQDAMSIQAAHLMDLARGEHSMTYEIVDKNKVKEYEYRLEGAARLKTAIGELDTVVYRAQRAGSKRVTRTWHAPSLGYLPVKGERLRDGNREFLMEISSLERR